MFRVDPAFESTSIVAHIRGAQEADYPFLEITHNRPVWILQAAIAGTAAGCESTRRYMFEDLRDVLDIASSGTWSSRQIYVLLPEYMSTGRRMTSSLVTEIWECLQSKTGRRYHQIITEAGVQIIGPGGSKSKRPKGSLRVWFG
jgi:hypothetical protein